MKKIFAIVGLFLIFTACTNKKLDKETALKILQEQEGYPKTIDTEIYIADPADARKLIDAGLEKDGYVKISHTQKLIDVGKPIIAFTDKSKPYLIPQTEEDIKNNVQRVRIVEEVNGKILNVKLSDDGKSALVEFKILFIGQSPFNRISNISTNDSKVGRIKINLE